MRISMSITAGTAIVLLLIEGTGATSILISRLSNHHNLVLLLQFLEYRNTLIIWTYQNDHFINYKELEIVHTIRTHS